MPHALDRKYTHVNREWNWQYVFPSRNLSADPRSGAIQRHHMDQSVVNKAINLEKSVGSWFLAQPLDSTALQKNARLTECETKIFLKHCETNSLHYNSMPN